MYSGPSIKLIALDHGLLELRFDRDGESINKFDATTLADLKAATEAIKAAAGVRGVVVTSAKDVFIVGADIFEFTTLFKKSAEDLFAFGITNAGLFCVFEDLPFPIVTAVNGFALGGGLEMALASDYRVMAETAQIGLPETGLGIIPGFGGTVRLPRLAGAAIALDWIPSGRPQSAAKALAAGAVDVVVEPAKLRETARQYLEDAIAGKHDWQARRKLRHGPFALPAGSVEAAKASFAKTIAHVPAVGAVIDLVARAAPVDRDAAQILESEVFSQVAQTQAADSLVQIFINDQILKRKAKGYAKVGRKVTKGAVLGAGIMGGGIAYASAVRGTPVLMKDIAQPALDLGLNEADKLLAKQVESGRLKPEKAQAIRSAITAQLGYEGFETADVIVEAVVENMAVKKIVLAEVEKAVRADAVIASNTSSLSVTEMATALTRPENFGGMHFFNPVPLMPLVEVIRTPQTSPETAATIASYAVAMGKTPIVVKECPGFLVNRILTPYLIGCYQLIRDGADFHQIDAVMETFGWPMGPAFLLDVIGLDTIAHVVDIIAGGFADRMVLNCANISSLMVANGRLGQKNGLGFYRYEADPKGRPRKLPATDIGAIIAEVQPGGPKPFTEAEIVERMMLPMIVEAAHCIEDTIVETPVEVDMALVLGLGFPRHVGGALKYADWLGLKDVVAACDRYTGLGPLYHPTKKMRALAASGGKFYAG
jgi:3-hydroxyacyl-CoA dehydrogenase/enoyl-CoA hydratase/3-hydroxybutyryl-CoA epimerase/enoyl-CoA isomerase